MSVRTGILFIIDRFENPFAGTESQLYKLINHLPEYGIEAKLLVLKSSPYIAASELPCQVDVLGHNRLSDPRTWIAFWKYIRQSRKNGCRLVHIFFNDASVLGPPICRFHGIRCIISRRDLGFWYTPFYRMILKFTGIFADFVLTNSRAVLELTHRVERIPLRKIQVIYNGYKKKPETGSLEVPELDQIRTRTDGPVAMIVANLRPIKKIDDAIKAVAYLKTAGKTLHLVVIGDGDSSGLLHLSHELGIDSQVHFLGRRTDIQNCLAYADMGLMCSESEGYSNAIVEYMFAGIPVVATDTGGNIEAVENGKTGWRYPVGNVSELSRLVASLIDDPVGARTMGENGRTMAESRHELKSMLQAHVKIYASLVRDVPGGRCE